MADFEVYSQKGLDFEKVGETKRMEDSEKVLENQRAGYILHDGQAVSMKGIKPHELERRLRRNPSE